MTAIAQPPPRPPRRPAPRLDLDLFAICQYVVVEWQPAAAVGVFDLRHGFVALFPRLRPGTVKILDVRLRAWFTGRAKPPVRGPGLGEVYHPTPRARYFMRAMEERNQVALLVTVPGTPGELAWQVLRSTVDKLRDNGGPSVGQGALYRMRRHRDLGALLAELDTPIPEPDPRPSGPSISLRQMRVLRRYGMNRFQLPIGISVKRAGRK